MYDTMKCVGCKNTAVACDCTTFKPTHMRLIYSYVTQIRQIERLNPISDASNVIEILHHTVIINLSVISKTKPKILEKQGSSKLKMPYLLPF